MAVKIDFEAFRKKISSSRNLAGPLLTIADPGVAETLLYTEPDMIIVDMEHSGITVETLNVICMASGNVPVMARIRGLEKNEIKRVLDTGVYGIIIPGINNAEDAHLSVQFSRFAPEGIRGAGPGRASGYGNGIMEYTNGKPLVFVQIETSGAYGQVEKIAQTKGLDGLFIGPFDLSIALGIEFSWENREFLDAVKKIRETAERNNLMTGIYSPLADQPLRNTAREGFNFLMLGMDREAMVTGYRDAIKRLKNSIP